MKGINTCICCSKLKFEWSQDKYPTSVFDSKPWPHENVVCGVVQNPQPLVRNLSFCDYIMALIAPTRTNSFILPDLHFLFLKCLSRALEIYLLLCFCFPWIQLVRVTRLILIYYDASFENDGHSFDWDACSNFDCISTKYYHTYLLSIMEVLHDK